MSRSNQTEYEKNPAEFEIEWAGGGDEGHFKMYDKGTKTNVDIPFPVRFAVLDELSSLNGWLKQKKSMAFSNEVHNTTNQTLHVKYFEDGKPREFVEGKYQEIKDAMFAQGVKYHKVVYALLLDPVEGLIGGGTLVKFLLKGGGNSSWIEKGFKGEKVGAVVVNEYKDEASAFKFRVPVFEIGEISEEEESYAMDADKELQKYFRSLPHTTPQQEDDRVPDAVTDAGESQVPADDSNDSDEIQF